MAAVDAAHQLREGEWPHDCETCPLRPEEDQEDDEEPCAECPLDSEEYQYLQETTADPLYQAAVDYLNRHELGLDRWMVEPEPVVIEAILFVSLEDQRQRQDRKKKVDQLNAQLDRVKESHGYGRHGKNQSHAG